MSDKPTKRAKRVTTDDEKPKAKKSKTQPRAPEEIQNMTEERAKACVVRSLSNDYPVNLIETTLDSVWKEGLVRNKKIAQKLEELRNKKTGDIADANKANFVAMAYNRAIHLFNTLNIPIFSGEQSRFYKIYDKYYIGEGIATNINVIIEELDKEVISTDITPKEIFSKVYGFSVQDVDRFVDAGYSSLDEIPLEFCTPFQQSSIKYYQDLLQPLNNLEELKSEIQKWFPEKLTFTPRSNILFVATKLKEDEVINIIRSRPELIVVGSKTKLFISTLMKIKGTARKITFNLG